MIFLTNTDQIIEIITGGSSNIDVLVGYADITTLSFISGSQEAKISTAATTTICSAPSASTQRQIKTILIENTGAANQSIVIQKKVATTTYAIFSATLQPGENCSFSQGELFSVHTKDGAVKQYNTSASFENFVSSPKQKVTLTKTAGRTSVAATSFSVYDIAGNPGAGTLAGTNTANGMVPTDATKGHPLINDFSSSNGYIGSCQFSNSVASRLTLYDLLFKAGAYSFNSNVTLASQPSYSARIPVNSNYNDTEIWIEAVTAFTGNLSIAVTYTNQSGTTGRTTGTVATGVAPTIGRMVQLPLQAGDTGVRKIESVIATVSTVGTFNVLVLRRLCSGRVKVANDSSVLGLSDTGMPQIFADSALFLKVDADSTSTGLPEVFFDIIG